MISVDKKQIQSIAKNVEYHRIIEKNTSKKKCFFLIQIDRQTLRLQVL